MRVIAAEIKSCRYRNDVMKAIEPLEANWLITHEKVLALLDKLAKVLSAQSIMVFEKMYEISELQNLAYDYAKAGFYAEAIAMLGAAELLYKWIAAAVPQVKWKSGQTVYTAQVPWGDFSFRDEVSRLTSVVADRKAFSQVVETLQTISGHVEDADLWADLLNVELAVTPEIRCQEIIDKCQDVAQRCSLQHFDTLGLEAITTLSYMPGRPTVIDMMARAFFIATPYVPPIIEACIRRGTEMESSLLDMFKGDTTNERFSAALALGALRSGQAALVATEVLNDSAEPLTRIGALFILVHAGKTQRQQELLPYLDDTDETTANAAAIALEHLPISVPDTVLQKHLRGTRRLVQLRLARHIGRRNLDVGSAVRDALWVLVTEADDDVGMAAAETISVLLSGDKLFNLAQDNLAQDKLTTLFGSKSNRSVRSRLMLMVGRARTEAGVNVLLREWDHINWDKSHTEYANHILKCLGETLSVRVVPVLIETLKEEEFTIAALNALLMVARQHPQKVYDAAEAIQNIVIKPFVRALLGGSADEIDAFKKTMKSPLLGNQRQLALRLASILAHPALDDALDRLRDTDLGNPIERHTWRYLATKASFAVLTRETRD